MGDTGDAVSASEFKSTMEKLFAELTTIKGDQSRLSVAVNRLQSEKIDDKNKEKAEDANSNHRPPPPPPPPTSHKLRFPSYDGAEDPLAWLHKCEQFFRAQRTAEDEKVWLASFYMEGAAL